MDKIEREYNEERRATGRSTRNADAHIQDLFKHGKTTVRDHFGTPNSHLILLDKILRRLSFEHGLFVNEGLEVKGTTITLTNHAKPE